MKKYLKMISAFLALMMMLMICPNFAFADDVEFIGDNYKAVMYAGGKIAFDGKEISILDNVPYTEDKEIMLPAAAVLEMLDYSILEDNEIITAQGNHNIEIDGDIVAIDGEKKDVKASKKDGVYYVSGVFVQLLGYNYYFDGNGLYVILSDGTFKYSDSEILYNLGGIYMSEDGKAMAKGIPSEPVDNLKDAVNLAECRIREYGTRYPIYIFVHGGKYIFDETVTLDSMVFKDKSYNGLSICAFGDSEPIFTGARSININNFKVVESAEELARLPKTARGRVAKLDLRAEKIESMSMQTNTFPYIYLNDIEQIQARWPNTGWAKAADINGADFKVTEDNILNWGNAKEANVYGFFSADYFYAGSKVSAINTDTKTITLLNSKFTPGRSGARWYITNLMEEIDIPGEYYVDRNNMTLYYFPPYSIKNADMEIVTFMDKTMISADGVNNLSISGINFSKTGGSILSVRGSENIDISDCKFRYIQADYVINASNRDTSNTYNINIENNECYACGGGLVYLKSGDIDTITNGNVSVENNWIASSGYLPAAIAGAIFSPRANSARNASCGITVKNNLIQDSNNVYAISTEGVNNSVLYNEIVNQGKNIDDGGTIYVGRTSTLRGLEVGFNYIHYLNKDHSYAGLYNDDGYCGADWHHNICADMNLPSINGVGIDQKYMYNVAYNCTKPAAMGDRMSWAASTYGPNGDLYNETKNTLASFGKYYNKEFPEMAESMQRDPYFAPWNTVVVGNVGAVTGGSTIQGTALPSIITYGAKNIEINGESFDITDYNASNEGNPYFDDAQEIYKDPENQNFEIKPDSVAAKAYPELLKIKMDEIGLKDTSILRKPETFKLKAPYNGQTKLYTKNLTFSWDQVQGASKYRILVAKDRSFLDIVVDETIRENGNNNMYTTSVLEKNTVYYWKVEAIGIARQNCFTISNKGGAYTFKTAMNDELEKAGLERAINSANSFIKEANTSDEYNYSKVYLDELGELIEQCQKVCDTAKQQEELDEAEEEIYSLILKSAYYLELNYTTLDDSLFNVSNWTTTFGKVDSPEQGVIRYSSSGQGGNATVQVPYENKVLCFKLKATELLNKEYQGIYFKYNSGGSGYLCVLKDTFLEFQKVGISLDTLPYENLKSKENEWCDVEMGAVNTPYGVLQFLRFDGKLLYAKLDDSITQTRIGGRFMIHASSYSDIYIMKTDKLPEKSTVLEEVMNCFNKPADKEQLVYALTGMGDILGLNSDLYKAVNKGEIADAIYDRVASGELQAKLDDCTEYKNEVMKYAIISAYNQGLSDVLYKDNITHIYKDEVGYENIDRNGVNLYSFYLNRIKDTDRIDINKKTASGEYKTFEDIQKTFAGNVLVRSINACGAGFAADVAYMNEILTKENAEYLGIDISDYLDLSQERKTAVNTLLGANGNIEGLEKLVELIHKYSAM